MLRKLLIWCFPLALLVTGAYGRPGDDSKEVQQLQKNATRLNDEAKLSKDNQVVFESLSKQLKVPVATLQSEQQSTKFGFGQLFIANSLAQASGKTFDQIAKEFKSGKGWGEIAKENNLKLGKVVSGLKRAGNQLREGRTQQAQAGHAQQGASRQHGAAAGPKMKGPHR
ncbi:MAG TPA: hypothetical protein VE398_10235 [Acidobacteriota bacterium]|nr:hypothetical protein [Acidobacteriota bacterium]